MLRVAYKTQLLEGYDKKTKLPLWERHIIKVDITDPEGVSWREAKKQLRQWYLDQASSLRDTTEQSYFGSIINPDALEDVEINLDESKANSAFDLTA